MMKARAKERNRQGWQPDRSENKEEASKDNSPTGEKEVNRMRVLKVMDGLKHTFLTVARSLFRPGRKKLYLVKG